MDLLAGVEPDNGGPASALPPATNGPIADFRLINAIFNFQRQMVSRGLLPARFADGRVDRDGSTLRLLNQFFDSGRGGGRLIPIDPKPSPPPPPAPKGRGFLASLFGGMQPRPTNLEISGTGSIGGSILTVGGITGSLKIADIRFGGVRENIEFAGGGLSLGPLPFGVEIAPSAFPSMGSRLHAGPRNKSTVLAMEDLTGFAVIISASVNPGVPAGSNASTILFATGSNRPLATLAGDIAQGISDPVNNFLFDAFKTSRAFASTIGVFAGVSVGISVLEVVMRLPNIRPDPDVVRSNGR